VCTLTQHRHFFLFFLLPRPATVILLALAVYKEADQSKRMLLGFE